MCSKEYLFHIPSYKHKWQDKIMSNKLSIDDRWFTLSCMLNYTQRTGEIDLLGFSPLNQMMRFNLILYSDYTSLSFSFFFFHFEHLHKICFFHFQQPLTDIIGKYVTFLLFFSFFLLDRKFPRVVSFWAWKDALFFWKEALSVFL